MTNPELSEKFSKIREKLCELSGATDIRERTEHEVLAGLTDILEDLTLRVGMLNEK